MSSGTTLERLWKLLASANKLVLDGKRSADDFCALLQTFIEEKPEKVWQTWKTITLGTYPQTPTEFRSALKRAGLKISEWGNALLGKVAFREDACVAEVELVVLSVAELNFMSAASRKNIYLRAKERGLHLCPHEVGPQLRLQYIDQPKDEFLLVAMDPIIDKNGYHGIFCIEHNDDHQHLHAENGDPSIFWDSNQKFIFMRKK